MSLLKTALYYSKQGISTIATDSNKRSIQQWKKYQTSIPTTEETTSMLLHPNAVGIALICGKVSGNMEVIDIDCKYDITGTMFDDFMQQVTDADSDMAQRLWIAKTVNGGYHIVYRCEKIEGNKKLAQRYTTTDERATNPHEKIKVLIETRGEAGYIVAYPSTGYEWIQNKAPETITVGQRDTLMHISASFNEVVEEYRPAFIEPQKSFTKSPFTDYNERGDIAGLLTNYGWKVVSENAKKITFLRPGTTTSKSSGDYNKDMGLFSVFTTSSQFESNKGYRPAAVFAILECNNDFKITAKKLIEMGYGEKIISVNPDIKKYVQKLNEQGFQGEKLVTKLAAKFDLSIKESEANIKAIISTDADDDYFWTYDGKKEKFNISYVSFRNFLMSKGYGLYFYDQKSPIFKLVNNDNNLLSEASTEQIKKVVEHYISTIDIARKEQLLESIYRNNNIFSEAMAEWLGHLDIHFLKDTPESCYIPFQNKIIEIKANEILSHNYGTIKQTIWKNDKIDHHIDIVNDLDESTVFYRFLCRICNDDQDRIESAISIIGYLLHKYKHQAKSYAVILAEETDDADKGGGTGKGIFIKALEKMLPSVTIDGKNFKPDKSFAYQRVKLDTKLVAIQDVDKTFNFEKFYSIITEGWTIEKKNQDELYITYADSPKVILTTNYTIADAGVHAKRRQKVIEFSDYFGATRTPLMEFGTPLFEWDKDEWNRFYNLMFECIKFYLTFGIVDITQGNAYKKKKIKTQFSEEFLQWFTEYSQNGCEKPKKFFDLYQDFLIQNDMDKKEYSKKRFKKAMEISAENFGFELIVERNRMDNNTFYNSLKKKV